MIYNIIYLVGSPLIVWSFYNIFKDFKFSKYFFLQTLNCWKCLSFWTTYLITILVTKELLYSLCLASAVSYVAFRLDKKINRDKDNNIKLW